MTLPASLPPYPPSTGVGSSLHSDFNFIYKALMNDITAPPQLPPLPFPSSSFIHSDLNFIYQAVLAFNSREFGNFSYRGVYNASSDLFPSAGGSGTGGAIMAGDVWNISVAGVLGSMNVYIGYTIRALVNTPGQTAANWTIMNVGYGYVPLNRAGDSMTGNLTLTAGTTSVAPLTFQTGTNLTTAASGNVEFDGTQLYFTPSSSRNILAQVSGSTALTSGSIPFAGTTGYLSQDNSNLFWDGTNHRLGIGTNSPSVPLNVIFTENSNNTPQIVFTNAGTGNSSILVVNSTGGGNPSIGFNVSGVAKAAINWGTSTNSMGFLNLAYTANDLSLLLPSDGSLKFQDAANSTLRFTISHLGAIAITGSGAASTPIELLSGTWFSGGSASSTKPQLLIEPSGTTSAGWNPAGTGLGVNAASSFTGNLIDLQTNGISVFNINYQGNIITSGSLAVTTNSSTVQTAVFINQSTGSGSNVAVTGYADGANAGSNVGGEFTALNSTLNIGSYSSAITVKNPGTNIGVVGIAYNTGGSSIQLGGYFGLNGSSVPTYASAALIADNASTSSPIFLGRVNGTNKVFIDANGKIGVGQTPGANNWIDIIGSDTSGNGVNISVINTGSSNAFGGMVFGANSGTFYGGGISGGGYGVTGFGVAKPGITIQATANSDISLAVATSYSSSTMPTVLVQASSGKVIVGPSSQTPTIPGKFTVQGSGTGTGVTFQLQNSSATSLFQILDNGTINFGTSAYDGVNNLLGINISPISNTPLTTKGSSAYGQLKMVPSTANAETSIGLYSDTSGATTNTAWVVGQGGWSNTGKFVIGNENGGAGGNVRLAIQRTGEVGIGTTSPSSMLSVGSSSQFQVNSSGAIVAATGITSSGTITFSGFSTNGGLLYTNGSGVFSQTGAGTSTTVLHGGTSPSYSAVSLTTDVSGILPVANGGTGVSTGFTIGSFDGGTASPNGASISSATLYMQSASSSNPGLMNTGTQTIAGAKTFSGGINVGSGSPLPFQINSSGNIVYLNNLPISFPSAQGASGTVLTNNGSGTLTWTSVSGSGVTTMGGFDGIAATANGASISGTTLYMQSASATNPGSVNTGTQTFAGTKTFSGTTNFSGTINSSGLTASQILATDGSKNLVSLSTGTYPSLTELSYVKGVTSGIQSQLNGKIGSSISSNLTFSEGVNIALGVSTGTVIGTATNQKLAFFNGTPASQQTGGFENAGPAYTPTEQGMLNTVYSCLRTFGFLS